MDRSRSSVPSTAAAAPASVFASRAPSHRSRRGPRSYHLRGGFPGTPVEVFRYFTDPKLPQIWMGVPRVDFQPGARGSLVGAEYHCIHGPNQTTVFKIVGCNAPTEMTMQIGFPFVGTVWRTDRLEPEGPSTTRVDTAISWTTTGFTAPVLDFLVSRMLRRYGALYDKRVTEMLQTESRASV